MADSNLGHRIDLIRRACLWGQELAPFLQVDMTELMLCDDVVTLQHWGVSKFPFKKVSGVLFPLRAMGGVNRSASDETESDWGGT